MSDDTKTVTDPYDIASEFAFKEAQTPLGTKNHVERVAYWAAWRAARNTAKAMLDKANALGLTPEQFKALAEVAEEWAYD